MGKAKILRAIIVLEYEKNKSLKVLKRMKYAKLSGLDAVEVKYTEPYTLRNGKETKSLMWMWLIPKGDFYFIISISSAIDEWEENEKEFLSILNSIKINL